MRSLKPGILAAAAIVTLLGSAAWSMPPESKLQVIGKVHVGLNDLDLTRESDVRALLDRLKQAAYRACGGDPKKHNNYRTRPEQTVRAYEECRENAVKRAVDQIGAPLLARTYDEQEKQRTAGAGGCIDGDRRMSASARARDQSGT